jgi:hypothetical protein
MFVKDGNVGPFCGQSQCDRMPYPSLACGSSHKSNFATKRIDSHFATASVYTANALSSPAIRPGRSGGMKES